MTATEAAASRGPEALADADAIEVTVVTAAPGVDRPGGVRFGMLVHALLSDVPLVAGAGESGRTVAGLDELADVHARVLGADAAEVIAAREVVASTIAHPVMQSAARAGSANVYREVPVTLRLDDATLLEGHVDLAFDDGDGFVVIDFKTDREVEGALDRYRRQVQIYAAAISRAMGRPAKAVLMRI
jgi:ATP-dependent exoDNAse (exonuclease V) beta subunit